MKKLYTLFAIGAMSALSVNAQTNLVSNGNFETWVDGAPQGFTVTIPANGGSVTQSTTEFHDGASSALFTAPAGTGNVRASVADIAIVGGHSYTFSYWFKDESDNARGRHWASWRVSSATQLDDNATELRPDYQANTSGWQQVTYTLTAPATATLFRLDFRVYQDAGPSGTIYYDNISLVDNSTASVSTNEIDGLKVFPNPLNGNTLNITSNSNAVKAVAIYDVLGKQVFTGSTLNNAVNVSLTTGIYVVKITEGNKTATRKLAVK